MDTNKHGASPDGGPGYETRDVHIRNVVWAGAAIVVVTAASAALMVLFFDILASREAARQPAPSPLTAAQGAQQPPEPRLQSVPTAQLKEYRAEMEAELHGYAWMDRNAGAVRIPIEKAMELVAREGLPVRREDAASAPPPPAAAAPAAQGKTGHRP